MAGNISQQGKNNWQFLVAMVSRTNTLRNFCGSGDYQCRAAGYDATQLDAVRKRSEGGRSSHTRMHSFTHNPRRTQHGARTTQSPPRRAMHTRRMHDRTHVHTHALYDWQDCEQRHAAARREYYTPSSQSCKGKRQQWTKLLARLSRNLLCSPSTLILCEY